MFDGFRWASAATSHLRSVFLGALVCATTACFPRVETPIDPTLKINPDDAFDYLARAADIYRYEWVELDRWIGMCEYGKGSGSGARNVPIIRAPNGEWIPADQWEAAAEHRSDFIFSSKKARVRVSSWAGKDRGRGGKPSFDCHAYVRVTDVLTPQMQEEMTNVMAALRALGVRTGPYTYKLEFTREPPTR